MSIIIPVEHSNRHVHLSADAAKALFGTADLPVHRWLSVPGEYATPYRVMVVGGGRTICGVRVLGPVRDETQVELLAGDIPDVDSRYADNVPYRRSGDLEGAYRVWLVPQRGYRVYGRAIIALPHIHANERYRAVLGDEVSVHTAVPGGSLDVVPVRYTDDDVLVMHLNRGEHDSWRELIVRQDVAHVWAGVSIHTGD